VLAHRGQLVATALPSDEPLELHQPNQAFSADVLVMGAELGVDARAAVGHAAALEGLAHKQAQPRVLGRMR
jgi:hypothetical protein